jgi:hypothetical protein
MNAYPAGVISRYRDLSSLRRYTLSRGLARDSNDLASVGIIGLAVAGDTITEDEAALILAVGFILWLYGIILTKVGNS